MTDKRETTAQTTGGPGVLTASARRSSYIEHRDELLRAWATKGPELAVGPWSDAVKRAYRR